MSPFNFEFNLRTRLVFGPGAVSRLGELSRELGGRRVLLVTDPGIVRAGHVARARALLQESQIEVGVFDRVVENPTTRVVEACVEAARELNADQLIGFGGGSSMDTAKGCNFLLTNGGRMEDYWGIGKARQPMLPMIAVPTTAGTGSECQSFALIAQEGTHVKMACGDRKATPQAAILDPELTLTQPPAVTASTGIDAISHAVESAVTLRRTPLSQMLSREAFRLVATGLSRVLENPDDLEARGNVLLGAALAGLAIENSMLGAAHAAANPLTARFGVAHGHAVGMMLPAVIRFNSEDADAGRIYNELARNVDVVNGHRRLAGSPPAAALADWLEQLLDRAGIPCRLVQLDGEQVLGTLAEDAARQWTAGFNPRPIGREDFVRLYRSVGRAARAPGNP